MTNITEREQWFIDRIGKFVWMSRPICPCEKCKKAYNEGLFVHDERYAFHLAETEAIHTDNGHPISFCDTKEEALIFRSEKAIGEKNKTPATPVSLDRLGVKLKSQPENELSLLAIGDTPVHCKSK